MTSMSYVRILIKTVDEWNNIKADSDKNNKVAILQIGATWCKHCHPVESELLNSKDAYDFTLVYTDASDSDLVDHFECSKLPSVILYTPQEKETFITQAVRTAMVGTILKKHCSPKLVLDNDF